jgi:anti-sigma-K factor RskA
MTAPDDPDMLAGELALGVLDGEERAAALRRFLADPAFARDVADWRARLDALAVTVPSVDPGPELEQRILASIGSVATRRPASLTRWRWATAISTAAAAALLGLLVLRPATVVQAPAPTRPAPLVAVIVPQGSEPFAAVFDPSVKEVRLTGTVSVPSGRDAELWAIGSDGVPQALGLLASDDVRRVVVRGVVVGAGTTLAISIEPVGGSPGPAPTGPVVATGKLVVS